MTDSVTTTGSVASGTRIPAMRRGGYPRAANWVPLSPSLLRLWASP